MRDVISWIRDGTIHAAIEGLFFASDPGSNLSLVMRSNSFLYRNPHTVGNKMGRTIWNMVWLLLYRPSPRFLHGWRRFLLRQFGAIVGKNVHPYPTARIWAPWNLEMGDHSCLGDHIDCYCVDKIRIGSNSTISQYSYLCTASHDYTDPAMPLITASIVIGEGVWIAADVFVGPGVEVGDGAVIGARSSVFRNIEPWTVVAGNPARVIKKRESSSRL